MKVLNIAVEMKKSTVIY